MFIKSTKYIIYFILLIYFYYFSINLYILPSSKRISLIRLVAPSIPAQFDWSEIDEDSIRTN